MTWGELSGWVPNWKSGSEQIAGQANALVGRIGHVAVEAWLAWHEEADHWFVDLPVVIVFDDGEQLELCWQKFDDLSVSRNTIDLSVAPLAWVKSPLSWRRAVHPALAAFEGSTVVGVAATQHLFTTVDADYPHRKETGRWLDGGLWFNSTSGGLHVYNALDENGLSNSAPKDSARSRLRWLP
ncbi:MAG: hypothetical protein V9F00_00850 [Nocardioides sp.]